MFYFKGARKPDFRNVKKIDYDDYWKLRGFELRGKLMEREKIFFDWVKQKSTVIDIGCGNSRLLYELKNSKDCKVLGLDTSQYAIQGQKQSGISAEVIDLENQSFELRETYDYAVMSELLEHLQDPEELIEKIRPYVERVIISVPNSAFYRYRIGLMFKGRFFTQWAQHPSEHLRFWSHIDFLDWLAAQDMRVLKVRPSNGFWLKDFFPNLFGHQICYLAEFIK